MPRPMLRSRTLRRVKRKTPGSRVSLQYKVRKPSKAHCGGCGQVLPGVPHERPFKMMRLSKTKKRPERPFGGVLCSKCMRQVMKAKARS